MVTESKTAPRPRLPSVRPWVALAALLVFALVGYYTTLGVRYWQVSRQSGSLTADIESLSDLLGRPAAQDENALDAELRSQQQRLEATSSPFDPSATADLVGLFATTARQAGVELVSLVQGEPSSAVHGGLRYDTLPATIAVRGAPADVYDFLSLLHRQAPAASVGTVRFAAIESSPSAQVQMLFYLSPAPAGRKVGPDNGARPTSR